MSVDETGSRAIFSRAVVHYWVDEFGGFGFAGFLTDAVAFVEEKVSSGEAVWDPSPEEVFPGGTGRPDVQQANTAGASG